MVKFKELYEVSYDRSMGLVWRQTEIRNKGSGHRQLDMSDKDLELFFYRQWGIIEGL